MARAVGIATGGNAPRPTRRRREPAPLEQIPVWLEHVATPRPAARPPVAAGVEALLANLNAQQRRG